MKLTTFEFTTQNCQKAFDLLQSKGYFNDEMCFGSVVLEKHDKELINFLKEMGYEGNLETRGFFYPEYGAIYWIFDMDKLSEGEAKKITDNWVKDNKI